MKHYHMARLRHAVVVMEEVERKLALVKKEQQQHSDKLCMPVFARPVTDEEDNICGTAACFLGWCGLDPKFRKAGFKTVVDAQGGSVRLYREGRLVAEDFSAAEEFFGLSDWEVSDLALEGQYSRRAGYAITPAMVLDKLKATIARNAA